ncbi:MAG: transcription antitermination factor NusB [Desulfobacterales bacterium]|nr:MAG: transcription antitermination factor NusB [Desulfobacterales bacterium]
MGIRRKAREAALQFLFQEEFKPEEDRVTEAPREHFESFCSLYQVDKRARAYALELVAGTLARRTEIDALIVDGASNWRLSRLSATDRNILRISVWEMLAENEVPDQVVINEGVEVAKRFGAEDSPSFINGVLDAVKKALEVKDQR